MTTLNTFAPETLAQINEQLEKEFPDVAALDGEVEVESVIDESSAKTFTARSAIFSRKGEKAMLEAHGYLEFVYPSPVPVESFDGRVLGFASVRWEGDVLVADVTMQYDSAERLLIETEKVYAESTFYAQSLAEGGKVALQKLWLTTAKPIDEEETHLAIVK